jgi:hypothetical protein
VQESVASDNGIDGSTLIAPIGAASGESNRWAVGDECGISERAKGVIRIILAPVWIIATALTLAPLLILRGPLEMYCWLLHPAVICFVVFPAGVFLHWLIATTTRVYSRWVWIGISVVSVLMLPGIPIGTISGGIVLMVLHSSRAFLQMRNGTRP